MPRRRSVTYGRIDDEREKLMADLECTGRMLATGLGVLALAGAEERKHGARVAVVR